MGFFDKLKAGLKKTKHALFGPLDRLFSSYDKIDDDFYEELSDVLIMSDVGVETAEEICGLLRARVKEKKLRETSEARAELHADYLEKAEEEEPLEKCVAYIRDNPEEFIDEGLLGG